jgi:hypothetical protein
MAHRLTEATVDLLLSHIKTNIGAALASVRAEVNDPVVTTEVPKSYFIYPKAKGFRAPAVFVIADEFDFKVPERGANFISGSVRINVSVLLEDRNSELLTRRCWRYQSALHELLAQTQLTTSDNTLKIVSIVRRARYSPLYSNAKDESSVEAVFRKEVLLELEVDHYENL